MSHLRYLTAGESHGQGLVGIIEGVPAGLAIVEDDIFKDLQRRQMGYGRGGRMKIETDRARILSGVRFGTTLGSPIALIIENKDWKNWKDKMSVGPTDAHIKEVTVPRPGHADLPGVVKYKHKDIRNVLERASARETAMRVALGAIAKQFLRHFSIEIVSHVSQIHSVRNSFTVANLSGLEHGLDFELEDITKLADASPVRCLDRTLDGQMMEKIDQAKADRDTVGGIFEVVALNLPIGLGSHVHWDRKLDARIAGAMISVQAMKSVEVGMGRQAGTEFGSVVHDQIYYSAEADKYYRKTNHAGGLEGGITNGMPLVIQVAMKPISTLMRPLDSVDIKTKEKTEAHIERSDVCAVPAASVIGESVLALVLADAMLEKFGGDSMDEISGHYEVWEKAQTK